MGDLRDLLVIRDKRVQEVLGFDDADMQAARELNLIDGDHLSYKQMAHLKRNASRVRRMKYDRDKP